MRKIYSLLILLALTLSPALQCLALDSPADRVTAKYTSAPFKEMAAKLREKLAGVKALRDPAKSETSVKKEFGDFVLEDEDFTRKVWEIIAPVFKFAGKETQYRLVILKTVDPVAFCDDNAVVVLSTGMLMAANSDDALRGVVAHEFSHSLHLDRAARTRRQYEEALGSGQTALAESARAELNMIEYECDAAATLILAATGSNPLRYLEMLDAVSVGVYIQDGVAHYQPAQSSPEHAARKEVVRRVSPGVALTSAPTADKIVSIQAAIRRARGEQQQQ